MELLDFSPEILSIIVGFCKQGSAVIETCRTLADIAFSTPSFWATVNLGSSQFIPDGRECLRKRLVRALDLLLTISIGWKNFAEFERKGIVKDLCLVLSEWNEQIDRIDVYTVTPDGAEIILRTIFNDLTPSAVFSALRSLTVALDYYYCQDERCTCTLLYENEFLYSALSKLDKNFPFLEFLSISSYGIPSFHTNKTFSHLRTLILDGKHNGNLTGICTITEFLSNTPQLETLSMKQECTVDMEESALNPVQNWEEYGRTRPMRIFLPHLVRLAVSAPGTGTDLLHYLEAPFLEYLHLHGRRRYVRNYYKLHEDAMIASLKSAASGSPRLRHLALTLLPVVDFETLLFGDGGQLPFPKLETLALHRYPENWGPKEAILTRLVQEGPKIPLRRLVLRHYESSFPGQILIQMFQKAMGNAPNEKYELEVNYPCTQITDEEFNTLEEMGVKLFRHRERKAKIHKWWTLDALNDGSDSNIY